MREGWAGERGHRRGDRRAGESLWQRAPGLGAEAQDAGDSVPKPFPGVHRSPPQSHVLLGINLWVQLCSRIEEAGFELPLPSVSRDSRGGEGAEFDRGG
jgi:hypothetical protein